MIKPPEDADNQEPAPTIDVDSAELRSTDNEPDETIASDAARPTSRESSRNLQHVSIPGYEILEELGRGGMGVVYKARQLTLNRVVALKMVLAGNHASPQVQQRFLREAESAAKLQHPHIVRVFDLGEIDNQTYFAMEFVEGRDLQAAGVLPPNEAAGMVQKLAEAIEYAHQNGIVHRDLKPANVLVDGHGEPHITDFGLAKLLEGDDQLSLTGQDQLLGTAPYMPPEQARGDSRHVGPQADVYALGAILYYLLTGQAPFIGRSTYEILKKVENDEPWAPNRLRDKVPADLNTICLKCLEKNPDRRYASSQALADDLKRFLAGEIINASTIGAVHRTVRYVRRKPLAQAAVLIAVVCLTLVLSRLWDDYNYHRPYASYFANLELRYGVPQGVGKVNKEAWKQRANTLRFVQDGRRGIVRSVTSVNSSGELVPSSKLISFLELDNDTDAQVKVAHTEFRRDADGNLLQVLAYDNQMQEQWAFHYTDPPTKGQYVDPNGYERSRTGSGAAHMEMLHAEDGRLNQVRYFDRNQRAQPDSTGIYGMRIEYPTLHQRTVSFLGPDGNLMPVKGVSQIAQTHDENGNVIQTEYLDENGQRMVNVLGYSVEKNSYNTVGNLIATESLDANLKPVATTAGVAKVVNAYDSRGFVEAIRFFDPEGKRSISNQGFHFQKFKRNSMGLIEQSSHFDVNDEPTITTDGYSIHRWAFDERGNVTEESAFDSAGSPTILAEGVHRIRKTYNERNQTIEIANFDTNDQPTINLAGIHRSRSTFEQNNEVAKFYYDVDGELTNHVEGNAGLLAEYDSRGNVIKATYVDENQQPINTSLGFAIEEIDYNENGAQTRRTLFDAAGKPTLHQEGWHRVESELNDRNQETRRRYFDTKNEPAWHADGYAGWNQEFDQRGNLTSNTLIGCDGEPAFGKHGYCCERNTYSDAGHLIESSYFDPKGKPAFHTRFMASRATIKYDRFGNGIEYRWFDTAGLPTRGARGYAVLATKLDNHGNSVEVSAFDERGELTFGKINGEVVSAPIVRSVFDARGNQIRVGNFDAQGQPIAGPGGVHLVVRKFDARNLEVEQSCFDVDGNPGKHVQGYFRMTMAYNSAKQVIERRLYDTDNKLFVNPNWGYAVHRSGFDRLGNTNSVAYFDANQKPLLASGGMHIARATYDGTQVVEEKFFGTDGKPKRNHHGYAKYTCQYDGRGNQIEFATYDENDTLTNLEGYAITRRVFDERNNKISESYFDVTGQPVENKYGFASYQQSFDERGRQVKRATFDIEGKLALEQPQGHASWTARYDERDNLYHQRYFGIDGKPIETSDGYAERVEQYDQQGRSTGARYFGSDGKSKSAAVIVDAVLPNSAAAKLGIRPGDVLRRYDGQIVTDVRAFIYLRDTTTQGDNVLEIERADERLTFNLPQGMIGVLFDDKLDFDLKNEEDEEDEATEEQAALPKRLPPAID
jgi:predicted Ser/Thr protein kinase